MHTHRLTLTALALLLTGTGLCTGTAAQRAAAAPAVRDTAAIEIFTTPSREAVPYRIPAITTVRNGHLVAVADYRPSRGDIGTGKLDLHARLSKDNGRTWTNTRTIIEGDGRMGGGNFHAGFGDPAIVADRESDRVLLLSCAGDITYQAGTADHHQGIARFYSDDGGQTWSEPEDITESIYSQFRNSAAGACDAMFVGSGRIFQSRTVKAGTHYRLYCSVLYKDLKRTYKNYVLYSDDFGLTWQVLGGVDTPAIPRGADEPKTEELPDGSVLVSSRCGGGRHFNIFRFTDIARAEGAWGEAATSTAAVDGVDARDNSTNGEVLVVPVVRKADRRRMHLLLQSVPFGPYRANVGICYKELASPADYATPADLARNWTGRMQVTDKPSAYSTMTLQWDKSIGFLYEEATHGADYTILYRRLTVEDITNGTFTYDRRADRPRTKHGQSGKPAPADRKGTKDYEKKMKMYRESLKAAKKAMTDKHLPKEMRRDVKRAYKEGMKTYKKGMKEHRKALKEHRKALKEHEKAARQATGWSVGVVF